MPTGFLPIYSENSEILILGSFPSVKSRADAFYYGNPQNRFWRTLSAAFGENFGATREEKTECLLRHRLALWDVVTECEVKGSLDTQIKNPVIADIPVLLAKTKVKKILCNGGKSYELLMRFYPELQKIAHKLPSTSPANVRFDAAAWTDVLLTDKKRAE